ncbi:hypothetical protein Tco_1178057 [Tanacetum coccineum]
MIFCTLAPIIAYLMMGLFGFAIEPKKSNRLSDNVDAPAVSIQQPPLSLLAYYSLTGQQKDFPVVLL